MAYGVEQDRLRAILPDGFFSLRPVLRINAEIRDDREGYIELNTAVEKGGIKGWLNVGCWNSIPFERAGKTVRFRSDFLDLIFTGVGLEGSCLAEKDNEGCFFRDDFTYRLRKPEHISVHKEFCDCEFRWTFSGNDAGGRSIGKTLPAVPTEVVKIYSKESFTAENAARIPCEQVLGAYLVIFDR